MVIHKTSFEPHQGPYHPRGDPPLDSFLWGLVLVGPFVRLPFEAQGGRPDGNPEVQKGPGHEEARGQGSHKPRVR